MYQFCSSLFFNSASLSENRLSPSRTPLSAIISSLEMLRLPTTSTLRTLNTWLHVSTISVASTASTTTVIPIT